MDFPAWILGGIGPGWVIGLIATFHVLVSQFAVGGGLFLPITEAWARKRNRTDVLDFLKRFTKFFLILTNVFGAISGIGIWWAIGLVNPTATSSLIRLFVFVWGAEWMVFLAEIIALVFYYYGWERMKPETHQKVGWIYAVTAWLSLFTINGILTSMLTPGSSLALNGTLNLGEMYFNAGFWPALFLRTLVSFVLAGVYATFVVSQYEPTSTVRKELLELCSSYVMPACFGIVLCLFWYWSVVDADVMSNLLSGLTQPQGNMSFATWAVTLTLLFAITLSFAFFFTAFLNPREFSRKEGVLLLALIAGVVITYEYSRELLRKPYVMRNYMYSNGVIASKYPTAESLKTSFTAKMRFKPNGSGTGEQMFVGQCLACHTMKDGYRSMEKMVGTRDAEGIYQQISSMQKPREENPYHKFMPPLVGTEEEVRALAKYIETSVSSGKPKKASEVAHSSEQVKPDKLAALSKVQ